MIIGTIKQWFNDYLDFVMPLIMLIVALNITDSYDKNFQIGWLSVFSYTFSLLVFALIVRLFTDSWMLILAKPIGVLFLVFFIDYQFISNEIYRSDFGKFLILWFIVAFMEVLFIVIFLEVFKFLKVFFANCYAIIKKILYTLISILSFCVFLTYQFEIPNVFLVVKYIFLAITIILVAISTLYYGIFYFLSIFKKDISITKPADVQKWEIDLIKAKIADDIARKEERERNKLINDIASAVRKRL